MQRRLAERLKRSFGVTFEEMIQLPEEEQKRIFDRISSVRGTYKSVNYAAVYGSGATTLARTAGTSVPEATKLLDSYWKRNWSVKRVAEETITKTCNGDKWLYNPVSKFWYSLRHEKDKFSTLNQGTGVYCFDTWVKHILSKRPQLTGQFHDEIILCIKKGAREKCEALLRWAIDKTNEELKLNRELDISVDFGNNYAQIH
jgi:DNA polymerase I-like protein with 3'-5' exonuclease and polymerase domains